MSFRKKFSGFLLTLIVIQTVGMIIPPLTSAQEIPNLSQDPIIGPTSQADCAAGQQFLPNSNGVGGTCSTPGAAAAVNYQKQAAVCTSYVEYISNFPICIGRTIIVWVGSVLIWAAGWILGTAGVLFNASLELTVAGFNSLVYPYIASSIELVWTLFRDVANIIIIGMFTFIALQIILNVEGINARKMIARVLIVAVLINFSLLFTRLAINASNFVAVQFYKAAKLDTGNAANNQLQVSSAAAAQYSTGISGRFAQMMGVASFSDAKDVLGKIAQNDQGLLALTTGIFTASIFLAAAFVFLYASFLLIARAILFIILLVTSSLAFATYLFPSGKMGGYGFSEWRDSLLKNAIFAPLLLLMLWATLEIGTGIRAISGTGTLGSLIANPTNATSINALITYLMILGMLFASIKIASSFASKVPGFNWGTMLAATPLALGARFAGTLGRGIIGRSYAMRSSELGKQIESTQNRLALAPQGYNRERRQLEGQLAWLSKAQQRSDSIAAKKFSLADTAGGKSFFEKAGVSKAITGDSKTVQSYGEYSKKVSEEAAKQAAELTKFSKSSEDAVRGEATKELSQQLGGLKKSLEISNQNAQLERDARATEIKDHQDKMRAAEEENRRLGSQPPSAQRNADMNREKSKIENAKKALDKIAEEIEKTHGLKRQLTAINSLQKTIKEVGDVAVNTAKKSMGESGQRLAGDIASKGGSKAPWASTVYQDSFIVEKARSKFKSVTKEKSSGEKMVEELTKQLKKDDKH